MLKSLFRTINKDTSPYNVLTYSTHERFFSNWENCNAHFYLLQLERQKFNIKPWNDKFGKLPKNFTLLPENYFPENIEFDFILSQHKFGQFQLSHQLSQQLSIPIISLEHTLPHSNWPESHLDELAKMRGVYNVFITEYSVNQWKFNLDDEDTLAINHALNTDVFKPLGLERKNEILYVCNDLRGRDWCCGFTQWQNVTKGLPWKLVGDNPGMSEPAKDIDDLVREYNTSRIYVNTAGVSPTPMSLLEAMSCGLACVSCNTCGIPTYIEHGVNGFLANNDKEMRYYLELLLSDKELCDKLGQKARETVVAKCDLKRFTKEWDELFDRVQDKKVWGLC